MTETATVPWLSAIEPQETAPLRGPAPAPLLGAARDSTIPAMTAKASPDERGAGEHGERDERDEIVLLERRVTLGEHGVAVTKTATGGSIRLTSPDGAEQLCIEITPRGAVLKLSRGLAIEVAGPLSFEADQVSLRGRDGLSLSSGGAVSVEAGGAFDVHARASAIAATHGDVRLEANDDVLLSGERIRVNC
jgi:hypothetical protein